MLGEEIKKKSSCEFEGEGFHTSLSSLHLGREPIPEGLRGLESSTP